MDNAKTVARWLRTFARGVAEEQLQQRVYDDGNLMWHIFSWELVPHLSGAAADALAVGNNMDKSFSGKKKKIHAKGTEIKALI